MLGRGEMIKRIPCRVVRTASLSKSCDASRRVAVDVRVMNSTQQPRPATQVAAACSSSVTDPKDHNLASETVTYTGRLGTARVSIDNGPMGQILDCYA